MPSLPFLTCYLPTLPYLTFPPHQAQHHLLFITSRRQLLLPSSCFRSSSHLAYSSSQLNCYIGLYCSTIDQQQVDGRHKQLSLAHAHLISDTVTPRSSSFTSPSSSIHTHCVQLLVSNSTLSSRLIPYYNKLPSLKATATHLQHKQTRTCPL